MQKNVNILNVPFTNSPKNSQFSKNTFFLGDGNVTSDKKDTKQKQSLHRSIGPMVVLAQIFALFPINDANSSSPYDLRFKWLSWKMLYVFAKTAIIIVILCIQVYHFIVSSWAFFDIAGYIFYVTSVVTSILFIVLARDWPKLMQSWYKVDQAMERNYGFPKKMDLRLTITTYGLMFFALAEHLLSLMHHAQSVLISPNNTLNFETYYVSMFSQVFSHTPPTIPTVILLQGASILATFSWNYSDLIIILLSSALALRFRQIAQRIKMNQEEFGHNFWMEIREDYDRLCRLTRLLDEKITYLVLHSFATNLFFILAQLFLSLSITKDPFLKIYFYFSFGFLIARAVGVSLYAAWINDESKEPLHLLNSLSSRCYNIEVRRLIVQITNDPVSLTGCNLFRTTRGLTLSIAGAIVTYELVLIQFSTGLRN